MNISAKIFSWDDASVFDTNNWKVEAGDIVIVNFDSGIDSALVQKINVKSQDDKETAHIIRKANSSDLEICERNKEKESAAVKACRDMVKRRNLSMKIVDAHFSFDGGKVTFSFIAEKRVDFRELVKDLSKQFQRSIRLQQIGSRDEAKGKGGFGACGRRLCCMNFSGALQSVTIEDARTQQMGQRGSDRLSGLCDRLRCCLSFESEQYRKELQNFPYDRQAVKWGNKRGIVTDKNIMLRQVTVEFEDKSKKRLSLDDINFDKES
ncbi:MAG: regulatory iron-sulfur-containing complex subunit RicT [Candidatus Pacebacteria bacterium]|jgi:cell fate regulator YaaT (PSP1 superfamily)|nr:regulatory iron-sulfur-containing complex subunit RicT [Candidatus Paceibacterota bacterium]